MNLPLGQHQTEIERNRRAWESKPLLREVYAAFYRRIIELIDRSLPGRIVEIGSGIGNLKSHLPEAISTDLFPNPWLDLVCDGYELPFVSGSLSHLILFDVFHHLQRPNAFLREARRSLRMDGRLILFEPFISWSSLPVYGLCTTNQSRSGVRSTCRIPHRTRATTTRRKATRRGCFSDGRAAAGRTAGACFMRRR